MKQFIGRYLSLNNNKVYDMRYITIFLLASLFSQNSDAFGELRSASIFSTNNTVTGIPGKSLILPINNGVFYQYFLKHIQYNEQYKGVPVTYTGFMGSKFVGFIDKIDSENTDLTDKLSKYYLEIQCPENKDQKKLREICLGSEEFSAGITREDFFDNIYFEWLDTSNKTVARKTLKKPSNIVVNVRDRFIRIKGWKDKVIPLSGSILGQQKINMKEYRSDSKEVQQYLQEYQAATRRITELVEDANRRAAAHQTEINRRVTEREKLEVERKRLEYLKEQASDDSEPTEAEMNTAVRSTLAGALLNVSVTKPGSCRKASPYDYYCRYSYLGTNWGNFWKQSGRWYFQIVDK